MNMKSNIIITVFFFFVQSLNAQKGIEKMIQAEKDFAAYSVTHTTKEAFQKVIDSNSIMFENGKPMSAIEFWNKREKRPGVLNWRPQYAEISASEDFGYTTGPWTYQNTINDSIIARGQYTTVWHLDKNGEWKFLVDIGIDNTQPNNGELKIIDTPKEVDRLADITHISPLVGAETNFNKQLEKKKTKAYSAFLSGESILTHHTFLPAANTTERQVLIVSTSSAIKYTMHGWGISPVPDMGYTYGTATLNGKVENYLRIWRKEKDGWKIAVEVLRY